MKIIINTKLNLYEFFLFLLCVNKKKISRKLQTWSSHFLKATVNDVDLDYMLKKPHFHLKITYQCYYKEKVLF